MKNIFMTVCFVLILFTVLFGQGRILEIDSIRINDGELYIDFHADSLFDEQVLEGLNRGLTVEVIYQVELWKSRDNWFDQHVGGNVLAFKLSYNNLEDRYIIENAEERRSTGVFEKALERCSDVNNVYITEDEKLKREKNYYVVIKGIVKPLSIENLNEVSQWLKGEVENVDLNKIKEPRKTGRSLRNYLLELLANITGFGDRYFSNTSGMFIINQRGEITYMNNR